MGYRFTMKGLDCGSIAGYGENIILDRRGDMMEDWTACFMACVDFSP